MYDSVEAPDLCTRCGTACRGAANVGDRLIVLRDLACPYLEETSPKLTRCTVYPNRFHLNPWCKSAAASAQLGTLGLSCAYRPTGAPGKSQVDDAEYAALWPQISEAVRAMTNVNRCLTWPAFFKDAQRREPGYVWRLTFNHAGTSARVTRRYSIVRHICSLLWR